MNAWAYDGSVVTPSEQTIYYNFNSSSQTITITYPNTADAPWSNYTKPTGDLVIPDSIEHNGVRYPVTAIGNRAFYGCMNITSVIIGDNVTSIGGGAFFYICNNIKEMHIGNPIPPTLGGNYVFTFYVNPDTTYLHVPCGAASAYQSAVQWNTFTV